MGDLSRVATEKYRCTRYQLAHLSLRHARLDAQPSTRRASNSRSSDHKSDTQPTELHNQPIGCIEDNAIEQLDPENMGIAVGILFLAFLCAEILSLPVGWPPYLFPG